MNDFGTADYIVDAGANVGYSSAYFLKQFPQAQVVAMEPDAANYSVLRKNLMAYGSRSIALPFALWGHCGFVTTLNVPFRGGGAWAHQFEENLERLSTRGAIRSLDVPTLMNTLGWPRIDILKLDIEGAEAVVLAGNPDWLEKVDNIVLEIHDDTHYGAISHQILTVLQPHFNISTRGELTIGKRHRDKT